VTRPYHLSHERRTPHLTRREIEIGKLIADGLSNKAIGAKLMLTEGTVKVYSSHMYRKLRDLDKLGRMNNRMAVARIFEEGLPCRLP